MPRSIFCGRVIVSWALISFALVPSPSIAAPERAKAQSPEPTQAEIEAREHIHQALLAETQGDNTVRVRHLATVWLDQPALAEANWHLSRVQVAGKWLTLSEAEALAAADANLRKYQQQRDAAKNAKLLLALARWCTKTGWEDAAKLHYAQILQSADANDDMRNEAIDSLHLQRVNGSWMTREEIAERNATESAIEEAMNTWRPKLKKLQVTIDGDNEKRRQRALADLQQIEDPAIIPVLDSFLGEGGERFHEAAVQQLQRFRHYESTLALVHFSVLARSPQAREAAVVELASRPLHEYVPVLLQCLAAPVKSQFQVVWDKRGRINYSHAFLQQGVSGNQLLLTHELAVPNIWFKQARPPIVDLKQVPRDQPAKVETTTLVYNNGLTPREAFEAKLDDFRSAAADAEQRVQAANAVVSVSNQRFFEVLEQTTKERQAREPMAWGQWWQQYNEYRWYRPTQCLWTSNVSCYTSMNFTVDHLTGTYHPPSCFLAGTPVRTQTGLVPIETIQPGDRVLSQDQDTGALTYKLVLRTTLRPPAAMVKIKAGRDEIATTLGHPFWVSGQGWRMAKQLKAGDLLHSVGGAIRIDVVEPLPQQPAHNLVVADCNTYLVGNQGLLVHDNEYRRPTRAIVPGLTVE
jgi:hypothetical protein